MLHENNSWVVQQGYIMVNIDTMVMEWTDSLTNLANKKNVTNMTDLINMTDKEHDICWLHDLQTQGYNLKTMMPLVRNS